MIIKPSIRSNVFLNSHPKGSEKYIDLLFKEASELEKFKGPRNVLIIGGSSGYGLSTRVALVESCSSNTINVSFEAPPRGKRTGTAGFYNNINFQKKISDRDSKHIDFVADAFSFNTKEKVARAIKENFGKIDLLVYSLAAGARPNNETGTLVRSSLKPVHSSLEGETIDVATKTVKKIFVEKATKEEIDNTVFVMGGSDWSDWVNFLEKKQLLNKGFKTISYTYVGSGSMDKIYRSGTIGKAKDHLEDTALLLNEMISKKLNGEALISSSKAVVTKASVFIPGIPAYVSALFDVMKRKGLHETTLQHKHRLFKDMVYGNKRITDEKNRIRVDHYEMQKDVQEDTLKLLKEKTNNLFEIKGTKNFIDEFYNIHGFRFDNVDYDEDLEIENYDLKGLNIIM